MSFLAAGIGRGNVGGEGHERGRREEAKVCVQYKHTYNLDDSPVPLTGSWLNLDLLLIITITSVLNKASFTYYYNTQQPSS